MHEQTLFYDEVDQRLLSLGGFRAHQSGPTGELWSFASGSGWTLLPGRTPNLLAGANVVLDTRRRRLVTFGNIGEFLWGSRTDLATYSLESPSAWVTEPNSFSEFGRMLAVYDSTRDRIITWRNNSDFAPKDALTREFRFGGTGWVVLATSGEAPTLFTSSGSAHLDRARDLMIVVNHATGATWFLSLANLEWVSANEPGSLLPAALVGTGFDQANQHLHAFDSAGRIYRRTLEPLGNWTQTATSSVTPSSLSLRSSAWDGSNRRFLIHGWIANEIWSLAPEVSAEWQLLAPSRPLCPLAVGSAVCFDTRRREVILRTGYVTYPYISTCYHEQLFRLWSSSVATYSMSPAAPLPDWNVDGAAGAHGNANGSIVYDPTRDRVLYFGGLFKSLNGCGHDLTSFYFSTSNAGVAVERAPPRTAIPFDVTMPPPPSRGFHGAVWDARRDRMIIAGGLRGVEPSQEYEVRLSDTWQLDGATLRWSPMTTSGPAPEGRLELFLDERRDRLIAVPNNYNSTDIHLLDLQTLVWTRLLPTGTLFGAGSVRALDPDRDRLLIYGGSPDGRPGNVLWSIQLGDFRTTAVLDHAGAPPLGGSQVGIFDPWSGRFFVHGGYLPDMWEQSIGGEMRKTWMLQLEVPTAADLELVSVAALRDRVRLSARAPVAGQAVDIERQDEDAPWSVRASVHADGEGNLEWEDLQVLPGGRYAYRLAWWDGADRRRSAEREVQVPEGPTISLQLTSIHPNPVQDAMTVSLILPRPGSVDFQICDIQGRTVAKAQATFPDAGPIRHEFRLGSGPPPGLYILSVHATGSRLSRRFFLLR